MTPQGTIGNASWNHVMSRSGSQGSLPLRSEWKHDSLGLRITTSTDGHGSVSRRRSRYPLTGLKKMKTTGKAM